MSQQSDEDSPRPHDYNRLDRIWNSIQQTKQISHIYDREPASHQKYHRQHDQHKFVDFETKSNVAHISKKMRMVEEQNRRLVLQLQGEKERRERQMQNLKRGFDQQLKNQLRKERKILKQNISINNDEEQIAQLTRQNQRQSLRIKAMQMQMKSCENERQRLVQLNQLYIKKLSGSTVGQDGTMGKGEQLLQLQQSHQTISRLVQLLRRTQQYREYAPMMQQVGNLHYLKNVLKRLKTSQLNLKPIERKACSCKEIKVSQQLLWSPTQCYKTMLEMKMKYDFLNEDCIEEVLFQMNRIYASKEQRTIRRLKQFHQSQITKFRKQIQHGYDEVLVKKQVSRLKKELSVVKNVQKSKIPPKIDHFKDKGQLADQLKMKEKQIRLLKQRIKIFQSQNGNQDKQLYYQGSLCALDKVLAQLQNNQGNLKQFQMRFRQRVEDNIDPEDWLVSYKEFFEALTQLQANLVQRILVLKQSIMSKVNRD